MNYYEVKIDITRDDKVKSECYITSKDDVVGAYSSVSNIEGLIEVTDIVKKKLTDVFDDPNKSFFYECKVESDTIEGKPIKETYLQKADNLAEARTLLLGNLSNEPEFKSVKETNIVDYLN